MREQSATYNPFADVRRCGFRATLNTEPIGARDAATVTTSNGGDALTMEELQGWTSDTQSGAAGAFASPPYVYITFPSEINTIGVTVFFAGQNYPTQVKITAYASDAATHVALATYSNSGATLSASLAANGCKYIKIEFLSMSAANVAVNLADIIFGLLKVYTGENIQSATIVNQAAIAGTSFPSQQLTLVINNSEREYDVLNPSGLYKYLEEGQPITAECIINDETVFLGTYYFQSASTKSSSMQTTIKAADKVQELDNAVYTGGTTGNSTLSAMVTSVLAGTGIATEFETGLASKAVSKGIPKKTKKREALRLLAQAACCSCWFTRDNVLHFGTLDMAYPSHRTFSHNDIFDLGGFSVIEKVDAVSVEVKNDFAETDTTYTYGTGSNPVSISNPCVVSGNAVAEWIYDCYLRRRQYKTKNRGDPALEIGDTMMIYDPYNQDFYATITGITLTFDGGITITTEGVGPGKPTMSYPYYSGELQSGELMNA